MPIKEPQVSTRRNSRCVAFFVYAALFRDSFFQFFFPQLFLEPRVALLLTVDESEFTLEKFWKFCCDWTVLHWSRASFLQPSKWLCLLSFLSTLQKNNWHGHQQLWRIVNVSLFWASLQQAWKKLEQTPKTFMRPKWNATKKVDKTPNLVSRSQALYSVWSRQPFCST